MKTEGPKYICSCENDTFEILTGVVRCNACLREYSVSGFASPDRFNAERDRYIKFDKYVEQLKK